LAKDEIGWEPNIDFDNLVEMMVKKDISRLEDGAVWF
jgi:GDP-D-mannose dehydratase